MANDGMIVTDSRGAPVVIAGMATALAEERQAMFEAARAETLRRGHEVRQALNHDIQTVESADQQINQVNGRVLPILTNLTGQTLGPEPQAWPQWWTDQLGYVYSSSLTTSKPTYVDDLLPTKFP
jgi:hypothetical protein